MTCLKISSTSFLIPHNKNWRDLSALYDVEFGDYGDWDSSLLEQGDTKEQVIILFIDDFIQGQMLSRDEAWSNFQGFLQLLSRRLQRTRLLTVIGIASLDCSDTISTSKQVSIKSYLKRLLMDEFELLADKFDHFYMVDLDKQFSQVGIQKVVDNRNWYFAHCHLSNLGLKICARSIAEVKYRSNTPPAKVLVLDCDNTIWGGVIGEDGIGKILLGQDGLGRAFKDFQNEIKKIVKAGTILCLASKNNEDDVWDVFDNHASMVLKRSDVTAWKINWDEKSVNIADLAQDLNVSTDSFVFWDDNPFERDKVLKSLPEVHTVTVPEHVYDWPDAIRALNDFAKFRTNDEDLDKTQQYQARGAFIKDRKHIIDELEYLKSIKLRPTLHSVDQANVQRAAQMCAKTNQFNLRTSRHTESDIRFFLSAREYSCFQVHLTDVYGDHGSIALVILREINPQSVFIDTFLMSCRVLGRHLEDWVLNEIVKFVEKNGHTKLIGEFRPTSKNMMCSDFYVNHNFRKVSASDFNFNQSSFLELDGVIYAASLEDIVTPNIEAYNG